MVPGCVPRSWLCFLASLHKPCPPGNSGHVLFRRWRCNHDSRDVKLPSMDLLYSPMQRSAVSVNISVYLQDYSVLRSRMATSHYHLQTLFCAQSLLSLPYPSLQPVIRSASSSDLFCGFSTPSAVLNRGSSLCHLGVGWRELFGHPIAHGLQVAAPLQAPLYTRRLRADVSPLASVCTVHSPANQQHAGHGAASGSHCTSPQAKNTQRFSIRQPRPVQASPLVPGRPHHRPSARRINPLLHIFVQASESSGYSQPPPMVSEEDRVCE